LTGNFATLAGRLREVALALDGREEIGDGFVAGSAPRCSAVCGIRRSSNAADMSRWR